MTSRYMSTGEFIEGMGEWNGVGKNVLESLLDSFLFQQSLLAGTTLSKRIKFIILLARGKFLLEIVSFCFVITKIISLTSMSLKY